MTDDTSSDQLAIATQAIRTGHVRSHEGEHSEPIFTTSSFVFDSAEQAAARFSGEEPGNIYARFTNPTVRTFEQRLAAMEGGDCAVATASGMAAISATLMALLQAGDHVLCSRSIFGTSTILFNKYFSRFGVDFSHVALTDVSAWEQAIQPNTKLLFLETPSNPLTETADIAVLAELAHAHGALLVVDNCFCTPALQRPLALGADIVIHSATKYLDGQGRCVGGAVVGNRQTVGEEVFGFLRSGGACMSPFNAWVFLKGLETLSLRMQRHSDSAGQLANWLSTQSQVNKVHYPGLTDHPQHELAAHQQSGFGGIVSFEVAGGQEAAWRLINATEWLSITANLGDAKTTITHPATTTHNRLTDVERAAAGISNGLVRVAVGLEDAVDIQAELARGLG